MGSIKGIVKWYNARKGYGFISPEDKSDDVFVHAVTLKNCGLNKLFTGSEVTFEIDQDEKGKRAKNLKVTKEAKLEPEKKPDVQEKKEPDKDKKEPDKKELSKQKPAKQKTSTTKKKKETKNKKGKSK